jgi:hypothetical protein
MSRNKHYLMAWTLVTAGMTKQKSAHRKDGMVAGQGPMDGTLDELQEGG